MAAEKHEDRPHQVGTTGHEWDGIQELNTPLPRWWLWLFYATIIWAIGYWVVYPAWPLLTSYTRGVSGWQSREAIVGDLNELKTMRGPMMVRLEQSSLAQISSDPQLREFAVAQGRRAFADNCAACHGSGGGGATGYPNLNDDDWLWGGKLDDLAQTIRFGIRSLDDKARQGAMPAFGRDKILAKAEIDVVADYVRSLSKLAVEPGSDLKRGAKVFAENCAVCHRDNATGNREMGAPNLTDPIWLYGSSKSTIVETITNGRAGVMPAWHTRLDDTTIKSLAVYVHAFGGGEK